MVMHVFILASFSWAVAVRRMQSIMSLLSAIKLVMYRLSDLTFEYCRHAASVRSQALVI